MSFKKYPFIIWSSGVMFFQVQHEEEEHEDNGEGDASLVVKR